MRGCGHMFPCTLTCLLHEGIEVELEVPQTQPPAQAKPCPDFNQHFDYFCRFVAPKYNESRIVADDEYVSLFLFVCSN